MLATQQGLEKRPIGPTLFSIHTSWNWLIADLTHPFGSELVKADTTDQIPDVSANGEWIQLSGSSKNGTFKLYLRSTFCRKIFQAVSPDMDIAQLDGLDAALVLEHVLTPKLEILERQIGTQVTFSKLSDVVSGVDDHLLGLEFMLGGETYEGALSVAGELKERLEQLVNQNSSMEEKQLDPKMTVHLGPVILPTREAYLASPGASIDCGVMPSDTIKGVLMRSDNYYWPIHIEDEVIEIVGGLAGPVRNDQTTPGQVFVTFAIGRVQIDAVTRKQIIPGSRISMDRFPDNGAHVYYQAMPYAEGNIQLLGNNLAVQLSRLGGSFE